jgi:hypothetical protein
MRARRRQGSGEQIASDATGSPTQVEYPYTLRGIERALADAVFRSIGEVNKVLGLTA